MVVYLLNEIYFCFYQTYCTLVVRYCYVTGSVLTSFKISRFMGVSIATALAYYYDYQKPSKGCPVLSKCKSWISFFSGLTLVALIFSG